MQDLGQRFRPMGVGDILDATFKIYGRNFLTVLALSVLIYLPFSTVMAIAQNAFLPPEWSSLFRGGWFGETPPMMEPDPEALIAWGVFALLSAFIFQGIILPLIQGGLIRTVSESFLGRKVGIREAFAFAFKKAAPLILTAFLYILAPIVTGIIPLLFTLFAARTIPGLAILFILFLQLPVLIATLVYLVLYNQIVVVEGKGYVGALTRSARLVSGYFWRMVGIGILFGILTGILQSAGGLPSLLISAFMPAGSAVLFSNLWGGLIRALTTPITLIGLTLVYFDLRMRKEGFDLEMMAQNTGGANGTPEGSPTDG